MTDIKTMEELGIKMLWHTGYYDGPLAGIAEYDSRDYYFHMVDEIWDNEEGCMYSYRIFALYDIADDDMAEEYKSHGLFRRLVGHHGEGGKVTYTEESKNLFYEMYPPAKGMAKVKEYMNLPEVIRFTW